MMKVVRKSVRLIRIVFGGFCCRFRLVCSRDSIMIMCMKFVVMMMMDGVSERMVIRVISCSMCLVSLFLLLVFRVRFCVLVLLVFISISMLRVKRVKVS